MPTFAAWFIASALEYKLKKIKKVSVRILGNIPIRSLHFDFSFLRMSHEIEIILIYLDAHMKCDKWSMIKRAAVSIWHGSWHMGWCSICYHQQIVDILQSHAPYNIDSRVQGHCAMPSDNPLKLQLYRT